MEFDGDRLGEICEAHGIDLVVLFGSHVRGADRGDSDLDVAVHLDRADAECDRLALIGDLERLFARTVDLVVLNAVKSDTLRHEIFRHGRPLYDRTGERFVELKVDAFLRFADSEYLRRVMTEGLKSYLEGLDVS